MADVFLSLGSNLGDREANIRQAIELIRKLEDIKIIALSSLYETEPVGVQNQSDFYNCVMKIETDLDPHTLLDSMKSIERAMGRGRNTHMRPRIIDIDILLYENLDLESFELRIPHSRLKARRFVLEPLLEIAPATIDPETQKPLSEFIEDVSSQRMTKILDQLEW